MASQTIQGWHPNPQLMQPPQQAPPPQGWTGSWPPGGNVVFPPGYPGPPPVPGGGAMAHPRWNAGYWQYNPLANMQNQQQPWAPGVGWQNYNPYKRVPKPPSPSYWNTVLTENGLGLEGMVKRKEPSEYNGEEPHTPWIWNPPSLLETGDRATPTKDFNIRRTGSVDSGQIASTPTRDHHHQSSRPSSQESLNGQTHNHTPERRSSSMRSGYIYGSQDISVASSGPMRHGSDPSDIRSGQNSGGYPDSSTSNQRFASQSDSWPSRTRSHPTAANEVPPFPPPPPSVSNSRPNPPPHAVYTQEPESFTSRGDLHPTFSSSVIRTPTHYQQVRRSTDEPPPSYYPRSSSSLDHPARGPPGPEPLSRQSSLPNSAGTRDIYANFAEDLSSSLNATTSRARNSLSRSRTEPVVANIANLTTIHESASALSSGEMYLAPLREPSASSTESSPDPSPRWRERRSSPYATTPEPSPLYRDRDRDRRPRHATPHSHSPSPSPHTRSRDGYASGSGGRRDANPLPPPPVERANLEASRPPVQEPSPPRYSRKVRVGFWNRRGDHLTPNSYVVYAPHDRAYPEELRDYPKEREGYMNQSGTVVPWREDRPELPASLPYHGRPPAQPYDDFVVYTYLQ